MPTVSQDDVGCAQQTGGRLGYPQVAHRLQDKKNIAKFTIKKNKTIYSFVQKEYKYGDFWYKTYTL